MAPHADVEGWVTRFHYAVGLVAPRLARDDLRVFRDAQLLGNHLDVILERLRETAVLVSVLSPRYIHSEWCNKELRSFWQHASETGKLRAGDKLRLVKVVKTPLERAQDGLSERCVPRPSHYAGFTMIASESVEVPEARDILRDRQTTPEHALAPTGAS